jgi:hypothetical protein
LVGPSIGPHDEVLQNLLTWKTDYVAIASRRGEGRGNQLMSKTGDVKIASRLVTVARSCFISRTWNMTIVTFCDRILHKKYDGFFNNLELSCHLLGFF